MNWSQVNYLNYGNSLSALSTLKETLAGEFCAKQELIETIQDNGKPNQYLQEVIKSYGGRKKKQINLQALRHDISESASFKNKFAEFHCRGFSYVLQEAIDLRGENLRKEINLRIALMPNEKLFYPPRIRRYLRRSWINHFLTDRFPSICFALGKITGEECYIFIMQSDLVYRNPAFIRDHFRGWRKILFANIVLLTSRKCKTIYLPSANDVTKCCHPFRRPKITPKSWRMVYDRTAEDFRFSKTRLQKAVNIQVYRDLAPVKVNVFYKLDLAANGGLNERSQCC